MEDILGKLLPVLEQETKSYQIKDYDQIKVNAEKFVNAMRDTFQLALRDQSDFKICKEARTEIRKKKEQVSQVRKMCNELAMGTFNSQAKYLETLLTDLDNELKQKVDTYEKSVLSKPERPKIITLAIKGYDMSKIEEVKDFAIKLGLQAEIK